MSALRIGCQITSACPRRHYSSKSGDLVRGTSDTIPHSRFAICSFFVSPEHRRAIGQPQAAGTTFHSHQESRYEGTCPLSRGICRAGGALAQMGTLRQRSSWGSVREDYSADGNAWDFLTHDQARSKAYRWGEDGIAGICDRYQLLVFALAFWNGRDPILKERMFGLTIQRRKSRRGCERVLVPP